MRFIIRFFWAVKIMKIGQTSMIFNNSNGKILPIRLFQGHPILSGEKHI